MSRVDLIVGPNGAGKSTFAQEILGEVLPGILFVNADLIARQRWPEDPEGHSYEAARVAEATRSALIESGSQFIAETVFSHPSKVALIDQAHQAGYLVALHVLHCIAKTEVMGKEQTCDVRLGRGGCHSRKFAVRSVGQSVHVAEAAPARRGRRGRRGTRW